MDGLMGGATKLANPIHCIVVSHSNLQQGVMSGKETIKPGNLIVHQSRSTHDISTPG